ncbi:hypothetical protein [Nonomuraea sp. JJY05]|uniref:hypothetical protein n=1 Tax=Nonomuraea sp. JJY05 TaxID=3350255 RepID=UPI00373EC9B5
MIGGRLQAQRHARTRRPADAQDADAQDAGALDAGAGARGRGARNAGALDPGAGVDVPSDSAARVAAERDGEDVG